MSHFFFELGISLLHSRLFSEIHRRGKIRNFHQDIQRNTINIKRLKWLANVTLSLSQRSYDEKGFKGLDGVTSVIMNTHIEQITLI